MDVFKRTGTSDHETRDALTIITLCVEPASDVHFNGMSSVSSTTIFTNSYSGLYLYVYLIICVTVLWSIQQDRNNPITFKYTARLFIYLFFFYYLIIKLKFTNSRSTNLAN